MSFSLNARAPTKVAAIALLAIKFDEEVLKGQPVHERDQKAALAAAEAVINQLDVQPHTEISVTLSGSLQWNDYEGETADAPRRQEFTGASLSAAAHLVAVSPVSSDGPQASAD